MGVGRTGMATTRFDVYTVMDQFTEPECKCRGTRDGVTTVHRLGTLNLTQSPMLA